MEDYFCVLPNDKAVQVWSSKRLPFEPKGQLANLKENIRRSVSTLQPDSNGILYGMYSSREEGDFDVENILFYNIGSGPLSKLARKGIRFERIIDDPPICPDFKSYRHYCHYDVEQTEFRHWKRQFTLATFESYLHNCADLKKPELVWYSIKKGSRSIVEFGSPVRFGLRLTIDYLGNNVSLVSSMKNVLDGVVAAFQTDNRKDIEAIRILSQKLSINETEVEGLLSENNVAVLGSTNLLNIRGGGIQWRPSDNGLLVAELLLKHTLERGVRLSGEIFTLDPIGHR